MKKLLVVGKKNSSRVLYLCSLLKDSFTIEVVDSFDLFSKVLEQDYYDLVSIVFDNPSNLENEQEYVAFVEKKNSYMLAIPMLLLSDDEHITKDENYLNDVVVDVIKEGESQKTIINRINNAFRLAGSTSFEEFSDILKALPSLIYLKDANSRYAFCTHYWHHLNTDNDPNWTIRGKTDLDIRKDQNNAKIAMESDRKVIESGKGTSYIVKEGDGDDADYLQIIKEPIRNKHGEVSGIVSIINNVTEQELLKQQLRIKSITDPLTGLYNRSFLSEMMGSLRYGGGTIISADCDGLKQINDQFGHAAGDKYILFATKLLKDTLPKNSYIFRIGGDEFLAILPYVKEEEAEPLVEKIMENAKNYKTDDWTLAISVGSYSTVKSQNTIDRAIKKSDEKMYEIKEKRKLLKKHK